MPVSMDDAFSALCGALRDEEETAPFLTLRGNTQEPFSNISSFVFHVAFSEKLSRRYYPVQSYSWNCIYVRHTADFLNVFLCFAMNHNRHFFCLFVCLFCSLFLSSRSCLSLTPLSSGDGDVFMHALLHILHNAVRDPLQILNFQLLQLHICVEHAVLELLREGVAVNLNCLLHKTLL